jgi:hypothetical protein
MVVQRSLATLLFFLQSYQTRPGGTWIMLRFIFGSLIAAKKWVGRAADQVSEQRRANRRGRPTQQRRRLGVESLEIRLTPVVTGPQIIATSYFDSALYEFSAATGAVSATLVAPYSGGLLDGPAGVTVGPDGNLYISSQLNNSVLKYDFSTATLSTFIPSSVLDPIATNLGAPSFAPAGLRFGPDGNLYVELYGGQTSTTGAVERFNITSGAGGLAYAGTFTTVDSTGLVQPTELTFGTAPGDTGNLYISDSGLGSVVKITGATTGTPTISTFIAAGSGGLNFPSSLLFGPNGNLFVVDLGATTNQGNVLEYNTNGSFDTVFTQPNAAGQGNLLYQFPSDAVFDTQGNLLTANLGATYPPNLAGSIYQFGSNGVFNQTLVSSSQFPSTGSGTSGISPSQLALFASPPTISTPPTTTLVSGGTGASSVTVTTTGSPAPTLTESGTLPTGVTFNPATGTLVGTPAQGTSGTYTVTITASNGVGSPVSQTITLTVLTPQQSFVQTLYQDELGRSGSLAELNNWVGVLNGPGAAVVASGIAQSPAARDYLVKSWYLKYLNRPAVNGEEQGWVNMLLAGQSEEQVLSDILGSSGFANDAQTLIASGTQQQRDVQALYQLLLNRTASSAEMTFWVNEMPTLTLQGVAQDILQSLEYRSDLFQGYYTTLLNRTPDASGLNFWVASGLDDTTVRIDIESSPEFLNKAEAMAS